MYAQAKMLEKHGKTSLFIKKLFLQVNEDDLNADIDELFKQGKIIKEFNLNLDLTDSNM